MLEWQFSKTRGRLKSSGLWLDTPPFATPGDLTSGFLSSPKWRVAITTPKASGNRSVACSWKRYGWAAESGCFREWPAFSAPVRVQAEERVSYRPVLLASGQGFKPEVKKWNSRLTYQSAHTIRTFSRGLGPWLVMPCLCSSFRDPVGLQKTDALIQKSRSWLLADKTNH